MLRRYYHDEPRDEATLMKDNGVEIFAIGIAVHNSDLKSIASLPTPRHKFLLKSFPHLKLLSRLISSELWTTYSVYVGSYIAIHTNI